ncbi:22754_t:CDS:2 [Dentiscutata erythropus]|uniref:22754_t:CDS:1 n=1 Tax=Dentiscutata erythropus TaxID=1348616 RepID=A0A9N9FZI2_9GLOM|nr:22754_t:CDS:2 [Dentiscutata erythropus]
MISREDSFMLVDDLNEEPNSNNQTSTPGVSNCRSPADPHFEFIDSRWKCKYCSTSYENRHTSTFLKHLRNKHKEKLRDTSNYNPEFKDDEFRKKLLKWIVTDDQAFMTLENSKFQDMLKYLQPNLQIPTTTTIRRDLDKCYDKTKQKLVENYK